MTSSVNFWSSTHRRTDELGLKEGAVVFHGTPVDDRGESAIRLEGAPTHLKVAVEYDVQQMAISIGGQTGSADICSDLVANYVDAPQIALEATTLGFAELFCIIKALITLNVRSFLVIYVEPLNYTKPSGGESFALSELISGYHPIPHSVVDLSSEEVEAGVFFLGYEPERMERALSEYQMITAKSVKVVFGVPAFRAGWELNAIVPHLATLSDQGGFEVAYCSANDPGAAFETLQKTRDSLSPGAKMFIAPIGTKPCGIATAVFASLYPAESGILFDHPQRKAKRSSGVNVWHRYVITINPG